nr:unnamed protein product [Digitaria exilis]
MTTKTSGAFQFQHVVVFLLAVTSLLLTTTTTAAGEKRCHSDDKAALQGISAALGNYLASEMDIPCCEWFSVDCDPSTGRVLSNLSLLIISWTAVSGLIPSFLGELTQLTFLDLSFNSLTGSIPASLAAIPNLSGINLSRNRLTGAIPPLLFSESPREAYLWLSHNNLTGDIPPEFAAVGFSEIDLSRNALTGDASALFGQGKPVHQIDMDLSRNGFSFNLSGVEPPAQLSGMDLSHNAIYGGIPAQVANLSNLVLFNVSYNRLCGEVPTGGNMGRFDAYSYQHNKCLCGAPLANPCQ